MLMILTLINMKLVFYYNVALDHSHEGIFIVKHTTCYGSNIQLFGLSPVITSLLSIEWLNSIPNARICPLMQFYYTQVIESN